MICKNGKLITCDFAGTSKRKLCKEEGERFSNLNCLWITTLEFDEEIIESALDSVEY
jgi:hypothetical protein